MPEVLSMVVQKGAQRHNSIPVTLDVLSILHLQTGACWCLQALEPGCLPACRVQPDMKVLRHMAHEVVMQALRPLPQTAIE